MPTAPEAYELCPCGSQKKAKFCCLSAQREWKPKTARTSPDGPKTDEGNASCYAAALLDCQGPINNEHFFSESVLKLLGNGGLEVEGFSWLKGKSLTLTPDSLKAGILCTRHNSALSPIDNRMKWLTEKLLEFMAGSLSAAKQDGFALISGHEIELWMLKCLCGLLASGTTMKDGVPVKNRDVPRQLVEILFGQSPWPEHWGLHVRALDGATHYTHSGSVFCSLITDETMDAICGLQMTFLGLQLVLAVASIRERLNLRYDGLFYRPEGLIFAGPMGQNVLWMGWDGPHTNTLIRFNARERYHDGKPPADISKW